MSETEIMKRILRQDVPRQIIVISDRGSGVDAAISAARRGADVTLLDCGDDIGAWYAALYPELAALGVELIQECRVHEIIQSGCSWEQGRFYLLVNAFCKVPVQFQAREVIIAAVRRPPKVKPKGLPAVFYLDENGNAEELEGVMEIETIADIFNEIIKTGAVIVEPATDIEIERCNRDLGDIGCPALPWEYAELLKVANGFAWNGFEFYGTYQVKEKSSGYVLRDIVSVNEKYDYDELLILGTFDEDYYVYDSNDGKYRALDRLTMMEVDCFESVEDLIRETVALYAFD